ncbi:MAG TPA: hypothetical protein VM901_00590 [Bdellovibrionota bacterium]|nr:hypothetical protein [Bdellovibrionota bacterium]
MKVKLTFCLSSLWLLLLLQPGVSFAAMQISITGVLGKNSKGYHIWSERGKSQIPLVVSEDTKGAEYEHIEGRTVAVSGSLAPEGIYLRTIKLVQATDNAWYKCRMEVCINSNKTGYSRFKVQGEYCPNSTSYLAEGYKKVFIKDDGSSIEEIFYEIAHDKFHYASTFTCEQTTR